VYVYIYIYIIYIYVNKSIIYTFSCAFVGLDNKLYKMHGTYIKMTLESLSTYTSYPEFCDQGPVAIIQHTRQTQDDSYTPEHKRSNRPQVTCEKNSNILAS
jgi:hypothetical protein